MFHGNVSRRGVSRQTQECEKTRQQSLLASPPGYGWKKGRSRYVGDKVPVLLWKPEALFR